MFTIREYAMPETLDEAYTILKSQQSGPGGLSTPLNKYKI